MISSLLDHPQMADLKVRKWKWLDGSSKLALIKVRTTEKAELFEPG
jgi:hypothetical protein